MDRAGSDLISSREVSRLLTFVESERRYFQEIIAMLPVGLAVVAGDKVVSMNKAFRRLLGVPAHDSRRNRLGDFLPMDRLWPILEEVVLSGRSQENVSLTLPGPPPRSFRLAVMPISGPQEQNRGDALIVLDSLGTEPRMVEQRLLSPICAGPGCIETDSFEPLAQELTATVSGDSQTVLIVDSDPGIRALMAKALTREGYLVLEAAGAEEALRLSQERLEPIHVAVSAGLLQSSGGSELIEQIRLQRPAVRALYVSPTGDERTRRFAALAPRSGHLQKPFTLHSLVTSVRTLLDAAST